MSTDNQPTLCGIGASAGGLDALKQFFSSVPDDTDIAFAIIMHLSPDSSSELPAIIDRATNMDTRQIEDGLAIEANTVYVIPPGVDVTVVDGVFSVAEQDSAEHGTQINSFFRSIARVFGPRSIGVVLSGMGTDGSVGIREIKANLGLTMAQSPESAEFPSMPRSAVDSGMIDLVAEPAELGRRVAEYADRTETIAAPPADEEHASDLSKVFTILKSRTGHDFSNYKRSTVRRRVARRLVVSQAESLAEYVTKLQSDPRESRDLFRELLIGVTSFFRESDAFEALKQEALPQLFGNPPVDHVRIWVPACSTGEEAYSVAILLYELLAEREIEPSIYIFATDIDERAISRARSGVYPDSIAGDVSQERLDRFFDHENNTYRVKKVIRDMLVFSVQDVLKDPPFTRLDFISCRNFLIYLHQDIQRKVIRLFHYGLRSGGLLMLGSSESTGDAEDLFSVVDKQNRIFSRRPDQYARKEKIEFPLSDSQSDSGSAGMPRAAERPLERRVESYLLNNHTPTAVFLDADKTIVYFHGRTGRLFEPAAGVARTGVLEMARDGLRESLASALAEAETLHESSKRSGIRVKTNGSAVIVAYTVEPLNRAQGLEDMFAVVFHSIVAEAEGAAIRGEQPPPRREREGDEAEDSDKQVTRLEEELRSARERLQTTIEELETRNEELKSSLEEYQSTNEELQSSNEELESSKEEMQSLNEELSTVNSELQDKNAELSKANEEMRNFLDRLDIPILVVDNDLRVKRFNEATASLINLIDSDINRPLGQVTNNLVYEAFIDDVDEAVRKTRYMECKISSKSGDRFWARMIPYKNIEQVMEGVLITFVPFPPEGLEER